MVNFHLVIAVVLASILTNAPRCASQRDSDTVREIKELSKQLFSIDKNVSTNLVTINLQGKTYSSSTDDVASRPLLTVNSAAAKSANRNVELLARLYDKYKPDCKLAEEETDVKKQQQNDLLDGLLATPVLTTAMDFLAEKKLVPDSKALQKELMHKLWFTLYARCGALGSSAFEHVFLGELDRKGDVSGMHSWLYFHNEEQAGRADYKGYIKKLSLGQHGTLLKVRFHWLNANKPLNSLLVGASPELEMALYTICFITQPGESCSVSTNDVNFSIRTYPWTLRDGSKTIATAFPDDKS